ncbi:UBC-like protein [Phellopilus nigrolimitatus]|nr:UBC-like protein [Phellopilus nigrolimitatus]
MATRSSFNKNNSAVKRIMQEARELANDPSTEYSAAPLEEWHCTMRGPPDTDFEGGLYHFRIILPAEYPFRPPSLIMLTPSGRFETNTKELWQPAWGVRTAIIALQGFFPLKGQAAMGVGSMEAPASERRRLAKLSHAWTCPQCKVPNHESLPDVPQAVSQGDQQQSTEPPAPSTPSDRDVPNAEGPSPPPDAVAAKERAEPPAVVATGAASPAYGHAHTGPAETEAARAASVPSDSLNIGEGSEAEGGSVEQGAVARVEELLPAVRGRSAPPPSSSRPPIALDAAIAVLLVLVAALVCRKVF